jgi:4-diphosphocytidyl-2-C-methyl-D-erythritol kinase
MTMLTESAPAKINLTLHVLGLRADGYHEIRSLVAFARDTVDVLHGEVSADPHVVVSGPFGDAIDGRNLIAVALEKVRAADPSRAAVTIRLEKNLPVASGIGGGSADAAAALRLVRALARQGAAGDDVVDFEGIARQLGADVPVCFGNRAAVMTGIGETLSPIDLPPGIWAVIVNPMVPVPSDKTARVFKALAASRLSGPPEQEAPPIFGSVADTMAYVLARENTLEDTVRRLFPDVGAVLAAIEECRNCCLARLSGAGPTCFGLFDSREDAEGAAGNLAARHPRWWIRASRLG